MNSLQSVFDNITNWPFLNEPLWRWGVFFIAVAAMGWGWHGILDLMK